MNNLEQTVDYRALLRDATTCADVSALMHAVDDLEQGFMQQWEDGTPTPAAVEFSDQVRPRSFRRQAIQKLRDLTGADVAMARQLIHDELLPRCLRWLSESEGHASRETMENGTRVLRPTLAEELAWETHGLREELEQWLWLLPQADRQEVRAHILTKLCGLLHNDALPIEAVRAICWTINQVGYRSPAVEAVLWHVVEQRDDLAGDTALSILASLGGVPPATSQEPFQCEMRSRFVDQLRTRLRSRPHRFLGYTLCVVAAPDVEEDALRLFHAYSAEISYFTGLRITTDSPPVDDSFKRTLLAQFADALPDHESLQDRVWQALLEDCRKSDEGQNDLLYQSNLIKWSNSRHLVPDLMALLPNVLDRQEHESNREEVPAPPATDMEAKGPSHHWTVYIAASRLQDAIRPRQLAGWADIQNEHLAPFLSIALANTHQTGSHMTSPMRAKEAAWQTLSLAGGCWTPQDVETAVNADNESSGFVRQQVLDTVACFGCDPLPPSIIETLKKEQDLSDHTDSSELSAYHGAEALARATATRGAFNALLDFGFLFHGKALDSTAESLSEVAVALARQGESGIVETLFDLALKDEEPQRRGVAIAALHALAGRGLVPIQLWRDFLILSRDESLDEHERSLAARAIGFFTDPEVRAEAQGALIDLWHESRAAAQRRDNSFSLLANRITEALTRYGTWRSMSAEAKQDFLGHFGLQREEDQWRLAEPDKLESSLVQALILLYEEAPDTFELALTDALLRARDQARYSLVFYLCVPQHGQHKQFSAAVADTLVRLIREEDNPWKQRLYLFDALAVGAPQVLLSTDWRSSWRRWHPNGKVALANAVGQVARQLVDELDDEWESFRLVAAIRLRELLGDGVYAVRRATARSLSLLYSNVLEAQVVFWASGEDVENRRRAAEAVQWLDESAGFEVNLAPLQRFARDPEGRVRAAAARGAKERREREWGDGCWRIVLDAVRGETEVAQAMPYGSALTTWGDDAHLQLLARMLGEDEIAPNIRVWLHQLHEKTHKHWEDSKREWPEPWAEWQADITEEVTARLTQRGRSCEVRVSLWQRPRAGSPHLASWGGMLWLADGSKTWVVDVGEAQLLVEDRPESEVLIQGSSFSRSDQTYRDMYRAVFVGQGPYPDSV